MNKLEMVTKNQIRTDLPEFRVGDTVKVNYKIIEGNKERVQAYEGIVIAIKNSGVERTFPMNSPKIDSVEVIRKGKVRRAKLTYLRDIVGTPKIKERRNKDEMKKAA